MKFLILLLSLLATSFVEAKSICTYVYNCAHCVVELDSDPPIKTVTSDIACFERLKADQSFPIDVPRNRSDLDKSPLTMSETNYSGLAISLLANSINRAYQDHQERREIEKFYNQLPEILEKRHQELMDQHQEEETARNDKRPLDLKAMQSEVAQLENNINQNSEPSKKPVEPAPSPVNLSNLGLKEQLKDLEDKIKADDLHGGFPNVTGKTFPDKGKREKRKNSDIQDPEARRLHGEILRYADKFRDRLADDLAKQLEAEAKNLRRGNFNEENSLTSKVQAFELSQAFLSEKREALDEKIESESSPTVKNKLQTFNELSGQVGAIGNNSFYDGDLGEGEHWTDVATQIVDIGLGFVPVLSTGKDLLEAITGENYITGQKLEIWERGLCAISAGTLGIGSLAKNTVKIVDAASTALVNSNKLGAADVLGKKFVQGEASLFKSFKNKVWKSADDLNEDFRIAEGHSPEKFIEPWVKGRRVLEFESTQEIVLYRVFSKSVDGEDIAEKTGKWLMKANPTSMDKDTLRKVYNITAKNEFGAYSNDMGKYVKITIPAGTRMRMGIVGHGKEGIYGGATQFNVIDEIDPKWISTPEFL